MKEDGATALAAARRMSHGEQLARWARLSPDAIAFQFEGERRSYAALDERVTRLARAAKSRLMTTGTRTLPMVMPRPTTAVPESRTTGPPSATTGASRLRWPSTSAPRASGGCRRRRGRSGR